MDGPGKDRDGTQVDVLPRLGLGGLWIGRVSHVAAVATTSTERSLPSGLGHRGRPRAGKKRAQVLLEDAVDDPLRFGRLGAAALLLLLPSTLCAIEPLCEKPSRGGRCGVCRPRLARIRQCRDRVENLGVICRLVLVLVFVVVVIVALAQAWQSNALQHSQPVCGNRPAPLCHLVSTATGVITVRELSVILGVVEGCQDTGDKPADLPARCYCCVLAVRLLLLLLGDLQPAWLCRKTGP